MNKEENGSFILKDMASPQDWKTKRTVALSQLTRMKNELIELMQKDDNVHLVKAKVERYEERFMDYSQANEAHIISLGATEEATAERDKYNERTQAIEQFQVKARRWIKHAEDALQEHMSSRTSGSKRSKSSKSSLTGSSARSSVKLKAQIAALEVERTLLPKKQALKQEEEKLAIETKIAKALAQQRIFEEEERAAQETTDPEPPVTPPTCTETITTSTQLTPSAPPTSTSAPVASKQTTSVQPPLVLPQTPAASTILSAPNAVQRPTLNIAAFAADRPTSTAAVSQAAHENACTYLRSTTTGAAAAAAAAINSSSTPNAVVRQEPAGQRISDDASQMLSALTLPKAQVPMFSGEVTEYHSFVNSFEAAVGSKKISDYDKLYYLNQYLKGEPRELISSCMYMDASEGYAEAVKLLDDEYACNYKISMVYLNQLNNWKAIKVGDHHELKKLAMFMMKCKNAMKSLAYLDVLNNPPNMLSVVQKLPSYLQHKWREQAASARTTRGYILTFEDLVKFVQHAADVANDPVYGQPMANHNGPPLRKGSADGRKVSNTVLATQTEKGVPADLCKYCNGRHDIDDCTKFRALSVQQKQDFVRDKQLLFRVFWERTHCQGLLRQTALQSLFEASSHFSTR